MAVRTSHARLGWSQNEGHRSAVCSVTRVELRNLQMTKYYKLTDRNNKTMNHTQWGPGVTHRTNGEGELCGPGWLHCYEHPLLAVLLNPIHSNFQTPKLWEAAGEGDILKEGQLKLGVTALTTLREIPLPVVTTEQRVRFAILCAKRVCSDPAWSKWADRWLSGEDRSKESAESARSESAAWSAARSAAWSAARSAESAESAAWSAAEWSAWSAARSAESAESAASNQTLDLISIAEEACK